MFALYDWIFADSIGLHLIFLFGKKCHPLRSRNVVLSGAFPVRVTTEIGTPKDGEKSHPIEEAEMYNNRSIFVAIAIVLAVMLFLTVRTAVATNAVLSQISDLSDYALRHPGSVFTSLPVPVTGVSNNADASDWFERHPDALKAANAVDLSDYYQRHPGTTISVAAFATDWFERHPSALNAVNAVDLSDYILRHPELLRTSNMVDQSDWFQRHADSLAR
jgi:hypothetical protein